MTGHYNTAAHASTPTLHRETSAFLMKACYQRHMLYGWAVALCVISIPALLISAWPVEDAPSLLIHEETKKDTVRVVIEMEDYIIIPDDPRGPSGGPPPPSNQGASGLFVEHLKIIADSIEIDNETEMGPGSDAREGPFDEGADYELGDGDGGTVFILDTSAYQFNSANLDRPPFLIRMDLPEYPALAKRIAAEGNVLLHILVDIAGDVAEVRIEKDDNPGYGFGESAVRAAWSAAFRPAVANHQPVRCWVAIPVEFEME